MALNRIFICSFGAFAVIPAFGQESQTSETSLAVCNLGVLRARFSGEHVCCVWKRLRQP